MTEQAAELALLQQQFSAFMDNMPAGAFMKDVSGHYVYANRQLSKFFGCDRQTILGATDSDLVAPEVAALLAAGEARLHAEGKTAAERLRILSEPDAPWWLLLRFPITSTGAGLVGGVVINITDQVNAEETIRDLSRQNELILQYTADAIVRVDDESAAR